MRTGPAPARVRTPRPALFVVGCCSPFVRRDHHYLLLATATAQPAGAFQPLRPRRERWAERNPLPGNNINVQACGPQRCQGLVNTGTPVTTGTEGTRAAKITGTKVM